MAGTNRTHNGHAGETVVARGAGRAGVPPNPGPGTPRRSGDPAAAICSNGTRTLKGTVESVNERGVKVGGRWLNYSKWAGGMWAPSSGTIASSVQESTHAGQLQRVDPSAVGTASRPPRGDGRAD